MNENLYIAHKKIPLKTLRVHSAKSISNENSLLIIYVLNF